MGALALIVPVWQLRGLGTSVMLTLRISVASQLESLLEWRGCWCFTQARTNFLQQGEPNAPPLSLLSVSHYNTQPTQRVSVPPQVPQRGLPQCSPAEVVPAWKQVSWNYKEVLWIQSMGSELIHTLPDWEQDPMVSRASLFDSEIGAQKCRITEWFCLEGTSNVIQFQPTTMGRAANHQTRLPRIPSILALNASRDGAFTTSLNSTRPTMVVVHFISSMAETKNKNWYSQLATWSTKWKVSILFSSSLFFTST